MKPTCPTCSGPIPGEDIDLAHERALCRPCGELFPLPPEPAPLARVVPTPSALASAGDHRPSDLGWTERVEGPRSFIVLVPSRLSVLPMFLFTVFWDAFLVVWYTGALTSRHPPSAMLLFPLLHVAAGIFLTFNVLVRIANKSRFTFDPQWFVLANGPLPQRGARESIHGVEGFDVVESGTSFKMRGSLVWCVRMLTRAGQAVPLALPIGERAHADFVAARLNAALAEAKEPTGYRG